LISKLKGATLFLDYECFGIIFIGAVGNAMSRSLTIF